MSNSKAHITNHIVASPIAITVVAVLGIILGLCFILMEGDNRPIAREDAISYSGAFAYYDADLENYREIHFEDGSYHHVYPHTESVEFREKMESLEKGTKLHLLINPNNDYVAEVRTDTEELLNFDKSQRAIDEYDNGYVGIGIFACVAGLILIFYAAALASSKKKEKKRNNAKKEKHSKPLRIADSAVKSKTLLSVSVKGYEICYRRVRITNELVINGSVYDERKGIIEFEHKLYADIDGHRIEAGYDSESNSYIMFNNNIIKRKKRLI